MADLDGLQSLDLRQNNPYSLGYVFLFPEGDLELNPGEYVFVKSQKDRYYVVERTDDIWIIANKAYGDSKYYWVIQQANNLDWAFGINVGDTLYIPDLNTFKISS